MNNKVKMDERSIKYYIKISLSLFNAFNDCPADTRIYRFSNQPWQICNKKSFPALLEKNVFSTLNHIVVFLKAHFTTNDLKWLTQSNSKNSGKKSRIKGCINSEGIFKYLIL